MMDGPIRLFSVSEWGSSELVWPFAWDRTCGAKRPQRLRKRERLLQCISRQQGKPLDQWTETMSCFSPWCQWVCAHPWLPSISTVLKGCACGFGKGHEFEKVSAEDDFVHQCQPKALATAREMNSDSG